MTTSDYAHFLSNCIATNADMNDGLAEDEMYGLYISWCLLGRERPQRSTAFWAAMRGLGISDGRRVARRFIRPGLRMTGPAAADYILARRPTLA